MVKLEANIHRRGDFAAVGAVTDERVDEPRPLGWLQSK
jgi:hypothetical protein